MDYCGLSQHDCDQVERFGRRADGHDTALIDQCSALLPEPMKRHKVKELNKLR
jgi:hypothetical protein